MRRPHSYFAGLFDGEGTIGIYRTRKTLECGLREGSETSKKIERIFALFGFKKSFKEGYVVRVTVDDRELNGNSEGAQFVSNPANRGREAWWAIALELEEGQVVKLETKVGVSGKGQDSDRTTEQWFTVNPDYPIEEIRVPKVGFRRYPLLKGKLQTISAKTLQEEKDAVIEDLLDIEE